MEYVLWRNFFSHYDFHAPREKPAIQDQCYAIERKFRPEEPEL